MTDGPATVLAVQEQTTDRPDHASERTVGQPASAQDESGQPDSGRHDAAQHGRAEGDTALGGAAQNAAAHDDAHRAPAHHLGDEPVDGVAEGLVLHRLGHHDFAGVPDGSPGEFDYPPAEDAQLVGPIPWELQDEDDPA